MIDKLVELKRELNDDVSNKKIFSIVTYSVLGLVGVVMTALNIATDKGFLTWCTGVFAVLCLLNIILTLTGNVTMSIAKILFAIEVLCMFTFFLVSGNPEGFSAIWICMMPSLGMFFFDRYKGSAICAAMFFVLVFFLWTPTGQSFLMFDYTVTFRMRFPILFLAFHALAFMLETLRVNAYKETRRLQNYYHDLSQKDLLTGLFNRQGMYVTLEGSMEYNTAKQTGVAMFDIDDFKQVNDKYGHDVGDAVLRQFAKIIKQNLNATVCRWGGEEFVAVFVNGNVTEESVNTVRALVESYSFEAEGRRLHVTASIGFCTEERFDISNIDALIGKADMALYRAKNSGKNKVVNYADTQEA